MLKAVLFDMDGIMFDTEKLSSESMIAAGKEMNIDFDRQMIQDMRGRNKTDCDRIMQNQFHDEQICVKFSQLSNQIMSHWIEYHGIPVKPGLEKIMNFLDDNGLMKALVTSTQRERVEFYFSHCSLTFNFDATVFGMEIEHGKPEPDAYCTGVRKLKLKPENCLVLEDSINGIKSGIAAGCKVIMIPDMDAPTKEIQDKCCDICSNLCEVINYIERYTN